MGSPITWETTICLTCHCWWSISFPVINQVPIIAYNCTTHSCGSRYTEFLKLGKGALTAVRGQVVVVAPSALQDAVPMPCYLLLPPSSLQSPGGSGSWATLEAVEDQAVDGVRVTISRCTNKTHSNNFCQKAATGDSSVIFGGRAIIGRTRARNLQITAMASKSIALKVAFRQLCTNLADCWLDSQSFLKINTVDLPTVLCIVECWIIQWLVERDRRCSNLLWWYARKLTLIIMVETMVQAQRKPSNIPLLYCYTIGIFQTYCIQTIQSMGIIDNCTISIVGIWSMFIIDSCYLQQSYNILPPNSIITNAIINHH